MSSLPPLYQRLLDVRNAFLDFHLYKTPSAALGQSEALVEAVNSLIDDFVAGIQALYRLATTGEAKAAKVQLENVVAAYVLDIRESVDRLEEQVGDSGLEFYADALVQAMTGEIERCSIDSGAQQSP
jgi:hypothetical protein